MPLHFKRQFSLCVVTLLLAVEGFGQSMRVTSWNLRPAAGGEVSAANSFPVSDAAEVLKKADPDVILLQSVPDWKTCERLAEALKPGKYDVVVCSSFHEATNGAPGPHQVAVLSKYRAYFSRSEPWLAADGKPMAGGFACVALRIANQPLGFFSVELPGEPGESAEPAARQLLARARMVQGWQANKVDAMVAAGTLGPGGTATKAARDAFFQSFAEAGFGMMVLPEADTRPALLSGFISTEPPELAGPSRTSSSAAFEHPALTCEVELDPAKILGARAAARAKLPARPPVAEAQTQMPSKAPLAPATAPAMPAVTHTLAGKSTAWVWAALAGLVALLAIAWFLWRVTRRRSSAETKMLAHPGGSSSYTIIVGSPSTTGATAVGPALPAPPPPQIHIESPGTTHTHAEMLQRRAEAAERRAGQAAQAIRSGVIENLSRWLKQKFVRRLIADRAQLMETQHHATMQALAVEQRLTRIEAQIQIQNLGYQQRIDELTRELIAAKEENRELIRAQIRQVKAEMEAARERLLAQAREQGLD